jgi:hypothetical protein
VKLICCVTFVLVSGCASWTEVDVKLGTFVLDTDGSESKDVAFFSASEVQQFSKQYGDQIGAVRRIDLRLESMDPAAMVQIGSTMIGKLGERKTLDHESEQSILDDVKVGLPVILPVVVEVDPESPMHCIVQPILVVQALDAL